MSRNYHSGPPPRRATANPAPKTDAAKQALRAFYCELCQKGYSRMDEYETHTNSYEHQHRKRFNELRQMQRDSSSIQQRREKEEKESGMRAISLESVNGGTAGTGKSAGFKTIGGGFKRVGGSKTTNTSTQKSQQAVETTESISSESEPRQAKDPRSSGGASISDSDGDGDYEHYDPRFPTD